MSGYPQADQAAKYSNSLQVASASQTTLQRLLSLGDRIANEVMSLEETANRLGGPVPEKVTAGPQAPQQPNLPAITEGFEKILHRLQDLSGRFQKHV